MDEHFFRLLDIRESKDEKTIRMAIVSSIVDSYETVINPDGCISPLESVVVDFNHNRISTGARIKDAGKMDMQVPNGEGGTKTVSARIVDVIVPKTARMWTRENKDQRAEDVQSLYECIENGRIAWCSVDFAPVRDAIEKVYNAAGELIREEYKKWRLNFLSLLDTKAGQDTSYFLDVRSLQKPNTEFKRTKNMLTEIINKIKTILETAQIAVENISEVEIIPTSDTEGVINFMLNDIDDKNVSYTVDESGEMVLGDISAEEEMEPEEDKVETMPDESEREIPADNAEKPDKKRAYVNAVLKNKSGQLGLVTEVFVKKTEGGEEETVTATLVGSDEVITINGSDIGWNDMVVSSEGNTDTKEWTYADLGDIVSTLLVIKKQPVEAPEALQEANRQVEELTNQLKEKDNAYRVLDETYTRLKNSPEKPSNLQSDSAKEIGSESAEKQTKEEIQNRIAKQQSKSRY